MSMREVVHRAPTDADAVALADTMRASDRAELAASSDRTTLEALRYSLRSSSHSAAAVTPDGHVICIYGVGTEGFLSNVGCPWFLASDLLANYRREFIALSHVHLAAMRALYPEMSNFVDARAVQSIRWLRWLGFKVGVAVPYGPAGELFCAFSLKTAPLSIQPATVAEIEAADTFGELLAEYGRESAIEGLPPPAAKMEVYRHLEAAGLLHLISATKDGSLVGFITVIAPMLPHYSAAVASSESFFVAKAHRKTGAGLKLLRAAEDKARELGSPGLLVGAPFGGDLFKVLPRVGYAETNRVFFKRATP